jgi:hypothetical protein
MAGAPDLSGSRNRVSLSPRERAGVRASVTLTQLQTSGTTDRIKCAILPWHADVAAVEGHGAPVTIEKEDA